MGSTTFKGAVLKKKLHDRLHSLLQITKEEQLLPFCGVH